jgi:hypothetical protein
MVWCCRRGAEGARRAPAAGQPCWGLGPLLAQQAAAASPRLPKFPAERTCTHRLLPPVRLSAVCGVRRDGVPKRAEPGDRGAALRACRLLPSRPPTAAAGKLGVAPAERGAPPVPPSLHASARLCFALPLLLPVSCWMLLLILCFLLPQTVPSFFPAGNNVCLADGALPPAGAVPGRGGRCEAAVLQTPCISEMEA